MTAQDPFLVEQPVFKLSAIDLLIVDLRIVPPDLKLL
jgi:hypothetical protein